jgi:hypothetical protein
METMPTAATSFTVQMRQFFGQLPGQSCREFVAELHALPEGDKHEFAALLTDAGLPCDLPGPALTDA